MADLIRRASGRRTKTASPPGPDRPSLPTDLAPRIKDRLHQAIRWGYQERELTEFERSLCHRASLGELLSWARKRGGHSHEELSQATGLSVERIQHLEEDRVSAHQVAPEHLAHLAGALDVSIWTLLERIGASGNGSTAPSPSPLSPATSEEYRDAVWSTGNGRRDSTELLGLRKPKQGTGACHDAASYREALLHSWRQLQEE